MFQWSRAVVLAAATIVLCTLLSGCGDDKEQPPTPVNDPPTACFAVTPATGTTETQFAFDASCASDPQDSSGVLQV